ncbi:MAG: HAMP domain-containing protein, partial [Ramlibacter sp.]
MAVSTVTSPGYRELERGALPLRGGRELSLGAGVRAGFGAILLLLVLITILAAFNTEGAVRTLIVTLGTAGIVAGAVAAQWLHGRITTPIESALGVARRITSGDLTGTVDAQGGGDVGRLMQSLKDMHARIAGIVSEVRTGTTTVAATSSQMSRDNEALSERTETQVNSIQDTAASMEELTAAVRQNADNAQRANGIALSASGHAAKGGALMNE